METKAVNYNKSAKITQAESPNTTTRVVYIDFRCSESNALNTPIYSVAGGEKQEKYKNHPTA